MKLCKNDEKLQDCIELLSNDSLQKLEMEMKDVPPHVFSDEFERKMKALIREVNVQVPER